MCFLLAVIGILLCSGNSDVTSENIIVMYVVMEIPHVMTIVMRRRNRRRVKKMQTFPA